MRSLDFTKMHSAGNDFAMIDATDLPDLDWPNVARSLCRHRFGVGADGLMVVQKLPDGDCRSRMFNPDGSEDMCGNGTVCAAVFLHRRGTIAANALVLDTLDGRKEIRLRIESGRAVGAAVNMGRARFHPESIPCRFDGESVLQRGLSVGDERFTVSTVSTGTPHTLLFCDSLPDDEYFGTWAPKIETHAMFSEMTSVTWVVVDSSDRVRVRIWERGGVGESLACGTGACAVAAVGERLGATGDRVTVVSKGGELIVELDRQKQAWLSGTVTRVFTGNIRQPVLQ